MKKFKRENCTSVVRAVIEDQYGRKITLMGTHSFDWSIYIEGQSGNLTIQRFPKGSEARKKFNDLKRKR